MNRFLRFKNPLNSGNLMVSEASTISSSGRTRWKRAGLIMAMLVSFVRAFQLNVSGQAISAYSFSTSTITNSLRSLSSFFKTWAFALVMLIIEIGASWGQVNYIQNWDAVTTSGGWSTNWLNTTSLPCQGTRAVRKNIYTTSTAGAFVSPLLGTSNGALVNMSFEYKVTNWSAGTTATPATFGTIQVQYGSTATGPWTTAFTINSTNHTPSTACATRNLSFTPPAGNLYVRFNCTYGSGDYWMYFDNVNISQAALTGCTGTPNAGTSTISSSGGCANASLSLGATGLSSGTGLTFQWQSSTDGGATWSDISGATTASYTLSGGVAVNTSFRLVSTCTNSGQTNVSSPVSYSITLSGICACATY
ncbi:MAG: hypothetical protein FJX84_09995, partial [Bacteroidetes bacterium]|nr:hypothetical protein [Bacteroidota bacterium]